MITMITIKNYDFSVGPMATMATMEFTRVY